MKNVVRSLIAIFGTMMVTGALVVLAVGCKTEQKDEPKVVAEQYRGVFKWGANSLIKLTEDTYYSTMTEELARSNNNWASASNWTLKAWTVGADLYQMNNYGTTGKGGTFTDVNTFVNYDGDTYIRTSEYD